MPKMLVRPLRPAHRTGNVRHARAGIAYRWIPLPPLSRRLTRLV